MGRVSLDSHSHTHRIHRLTPTHARSRRGAPTGVPRRLLAGAALAGRAWSDNTTLSRHTSLSHHTRTRRSPRTSRIVVVRTGRVFTRTGRERVLSVYPPCPDGTSVAVCLSLQYHRGPADGVVLRAHVYTAPPAPPVCLLPPLGRRHTPPLDPSCISFRLRAPLDLRLTH
jgi:hypothetical protein